MYIACVLLLCTSWATVVSSSSYATGIETLMSATAALNDTTGTSPCPTSLPSSPMDSESVITSTNASCYTSCLNSTVQMTTTERIQITQVNHQPQEQSTTSMYNLPSSILLSPSEMPSTPPNNYIDVRVSNIEPTQYYDTRAGYFGFVVYQISFQTSDNAANVEYLIGSTWLYQNYTGRAFNNTNSLSGVLMADYDDYNGYNDGPLCNSHGVIEVYTFSSFEITCAKTLFCNSSANSADIELICTPEWLLNIAMFRLTIAMKLNFSSAVMEVLNNAVGEIQNENEAKIYNTSIPINVYNSSYLFDPLNVHPGIYVFTANISFSDFSYPLTLIPKNQLPILTKSCTINANHPSFPVIWVNLTSNPIWAIDVTNHTVLLNLSISWKPPNGTIKLYTVWIGGAEWNFTSGNASCDMQGEDAECIYMSMYNLELNNSTCIKLKTLSEYDVWSEWSLPTCFNITLPKLNSTIASHTQQITQSNHGSYKLISSPLQVLSSPPASVVQTPSLNSDVSYLFYIFIPLVLVLIVIVAVLLLVIIIKRKKIVQPEMTNMTEMEDHIKITNATMKQDSWEVDRGDFVIDPHNKLGEGAFGEVYMGTVCGPYLQSNQSLPSAIRMAVNVPVAIKVLKSKAQDKDKQDFIKEIDMMKRITPGNTHIVNMIGCVTISEPMCLLCELVKHGSLLPYLRSHHKKEGSSVHSDSSLKIPLCTPPSPYLEAWDVYSHLESCPPELEPMMPKDFPSFCFQIADGMEHLSRLGIIHRDLACRNILIGENKTLKITDFGLSREVEEVYEVKGMRMLPWRWMAIESLERRIFTTYSDVWSFGITIWEISTFGGFPYPSIPNETLLKTLKSGYRMERPDNCSEEVYSIMTRCWSEDPHERFSFTELRSRFERMLEMPHDYYIQPLSGNDEYIYIPQDVTESSDQNNIQMETVTSVNSDTGATLPKIAICGALSKRLSETVL